MKVLRTDREGDVVIAKVQTAGRGREGRSWSSNSGGLWLTIVLQPPASRVLEKVTFIAARAVVRTLEEFGLKGAQVKPPNDIQCSGKKIAGILADTMLQGKLSTVYLGVGIDVNNDTGQDPSISQIATSVSRELGRQTDISIFTLSFLKHLDDEYNAEIESCLSTD
jgi:BirA family biotin operon repressor/biotin-[acetyl-CoA-carboxylase] ligase